MDGRRAGTAVLLAAAAALGGCCSTAAGDPKGDRDTPERAFDYVRRAFAEDRTEDQFDSLHWAFAKRQGITDLKYRVARRLRPGVFRKAADLLGGATLDAVEYGDLADPARPRKAARVRLSTPGGRGVFVLVDEPRWVLVTDDGPFPGRLADMEKVVRIEADALVADLRRPLDDLPAEGSRIHRLVIHHDWLLYDVESLDGFEELMGEVRAAESVSP
jgi:hypothetical protein